MLTKHERAMVRAKLRVVSEALEDFHACLDPANNIILKEAQRRSLVLRNAVNELKRYIEEDLS